MDQGLVSGLVSLFSLIIVLPPVTQILHRAGYSRWHALFLFVPLINLVGLYMFAFGKWPVEETAHRQQEQWSDADNEAFKRLLERQQK